MSAHDVTEIDSADSLIYRIIEKVAAAKGVQAHELDPLYEVIDPDALEELFAGPSQQGQIGFEYEGCTVRADGDGQVTVVSPRDN